MAKLSLRDIDVAGKKVIMRVDFNVPLNESLEITDETRITAALESIRYIRDKGGMVILMSHLGRPKGGPEKKYSLAPVAARLGQLLGRKVVLAPDCIGPEVAKLAAGLKAGDVLLLENLRFHKEEEDNDTGFAKQLASLADVYVNDAFGTAHRAHASTAGIAAFMKVSAAGFLMEKEIEFLGDALANPKRPFVAILGGAKIKDKIPVIERLRKIADAIIIGGGMSYTFQKARGMNVGTSLLDEGSLDFAREVMANSGKNGMARMLFPLDYIISTDIDAVEYKKITADKNIDDGYMGVDIGPQTIEKFKAEIAKAAMVVWNGPMGVFETPAFSKGTMAVANAIAASGAISIVGGGDSVSAVNKSGIADKITHISTGGGASLEYMEGKVLPGIDVLNDK